MILFLVSISLPFSYRDFKSSKTFFGISSYSCNFLKTHQIFLLQPPLKTPHKITYVIIINNLLPNKNIYSCYDYCHSYFNKVGNMSYWLF